MRASRGFSAIDDLKNSAFSSYFVTTRRWSSRDVELLTTGTFELSSSQQLDNSATRRSTPLYFLHAHLLYVVFHAAHKGDMHRMTGLCYLLWSWINLHRQKTFSGTAKFGFL